MPTDKLSQVQQARQAGIVNVLRGFYPFPHGFAPRVVEKLKQEGVAVAAINVYNAVYNRYKGEHRQRIIKAVAEDAIRHRAEEDALSRDISQLRSTLENNVNYGT